MSQKKEEAIQKVMTDFENMANLVLSQLDNLENFFQSGEIAVSAQIAEEILENEKKIDNLEVKLSERIVNTIVLYQPVAIDIRKLFACYRIINNLERIGDYTVNLLNYISKIKSPELYTQMADVITSMFISSAHMVKKSLLSYIHHDKEFAIWTIKNDAIVDEMNKKLLKGLISRSKSFDDKKKAMVSFISIKEMVDNIERIADQATNIAEAAIYYMEGKDIRHLPLEEEPPSPLKEEN
jgi:phosphate transport system protein